MEYQFADTHNTAQELIRMGMSESNARKLAFGAVANLNAATKQGVAEIHKEIAIIHKDIEIIHKDIEQLRSDTQRDIAIIHKDIEQLRADTKKDFELVRRDIKIAQYVAVGAIVSSIVLLQPLMQFATKLLAN